jgi:hypothetical protein
MNIGENFMQEPAENKKTSSEQPSEVITCEQLAERLTLPVSWIRDQARERAVDPIPHFKFGRYVRFHWQSAELESWITRRKRGGKKISSN